MFYFKYKNCMACALLWIMGCTFVTAEDELQAEKVFIVIGKVEQVTEINEANKQSIIAYKDWSGLTPPAFEAKCIVQEILKGPLNLNGMHAYGMTRDQNMIGNLGVIFPTLKAGEIGIFPVYADKDHLRFMPHVGYPVGVGKLPSVLGRDPNFESLRTFLVQRRDQPEQVEEKKQVLELLRDQPLTVDSRRETAATATINPHGGVSRWWGVLEALALIFALACGAWALRRKI
ncbi:hypothetical protein [Prosthecobacter sp.]|uniref:hypothetical protein n=1 Tax=Prosthecobacter sp. TaxID=1965333 RepID=UPI0037851E59